MEAIARTGPQPIAALLTVQEVARNLRVSDETVRRRIRDGSLGAVQFGSIIRVPSAELNRLLGERVDPESKEKR